VDAAGRQQYLYHPDWRAKRDQMKFDRVAYKQTRRWLPVDAMTVTEYLRETTGAEITAKDFRTRHANRPGRSVAGSL
jgi:DNA topoisomerase IB